MLLLLHLSAARMISAIGMASRMILARTRCTAEAIRLTRRKLVLDGHSSSDGQGELGNWGLSACDGTSYHKDEVNSDVDVQGMIRQRLRCPRLFQEQVAEAKTCAGWAEHLHVKI